MASITRRVNSLDLLRYRLAITTRCGALPQLTPQCIGMRPKLCVLLIRQRKRLHQFFLQMAETIKFPTHALTRWSQAIRLHALQMKLSEPHHGMSVLVPLRYSARNATAHKTTHDTTQAGEYHDSHHTYTL